MIIPAAVLIPRDTADPRRLQPCPRRQTADILDCPRSARRAVSGPASATGDGAGGRERRRDVLVTVLGTPSSPACPMTATRSTWRRSTRSPNCSPPRRAARLPPGLRRRLPGGVDAPRRPATAGPDDTGGDAARADVQPARADRPVRRLVGTTTATPTSPSSRPRSTSTWASPTATATGPRWTARARPALRPTLRRSPAATTRHDGPGMGQRRRTDGRPQRPPHVLPVDTDEDRGKFLLTAHSEVINHGATIVEETFRDLLESGAWRSYTFPDGTHHEWLEREFDYFVSSWLAPRTTSAGSRQAQPRVARRDHGDGRPLRRSPRR